MRLDDDSDEDKVFLCPFSVCFLLVVAVCLTEHLCLKLLEEESLEAVMSGVEMAVKEAVPVTTPDEKRAGPSLEELEAKQGEL